MKRIIKFIAGNPWSFLLAALPVTLPRNFCTGHRQ